MSIVRITGVNVATGKERPLELGDTIENFSLSGQAMNFMGAIDGAGFPWPDEATARANGDTYTITAGSEITDPEGTGQTVQPGDEIVWDETGGWWIIIGNADTANVKSALLNVLLADEDLLIRRGSDIVRFAKGSDGQFLGMVAGAVAWVASPVSDGKVFAPINTLTPSAGNTYAVDMTGYAAPKINAAAAADIILSLTNLSVAYTRSVTIRIENSSGGLRDFDWTNDTGWLWASDRPTDIADGAVALLTITTWGNMAADVSIAYKVIEAA